MKLFLKNIFKLSVIIIILPFSLILGMELIFKNIDTSDIYPKYLKLSNQKINFPLDILVAGDSRAERQIIPEMLKSKNQKNILNLGVSSGDVNQLRDFIINREEANSLINKKTILLISASNWQINDNIQRWGYFSRSTFKYLSFYGKFDVLTDKQDYLKYVIALYKNKIKNLLHSNYKSDINSLGYYPIEGDITALSDIELKKNISDGLNFRSDIKDNGYKWEEFKKSIKFFSGEFDKVIIIINPVTDIWRKSIEKTKIEDFNQNVIFKTQEFIKSENLSNTLVWDFYNKNDLQINDSDYYDTHHFNNLGAMKFTSKLRKKLDFLSDSITKP